MGGLFTLQIQVLTNKRFLREMKKTEYQAPEMEIIKLKAPIVLQAASDSSTTTGGLDDEITDGDA